MASLTNLPILRTIPLLITVCLVSISAQAKYGGGSGTANDPYQIGTAADLILLGESPEDYDKHFILTDNIDLDPNRPGRKVFDRAIIAPDVNEITVWEFDGTTFTGVFDGKGYAILHLRIKGESYLGLFGCLGYGGEVKNLGVVDVNITGSGNYVGGLVGINGDWSDPGAAISNCYSTGTVSGTFCVGGLVGETYYGTISHCYSIGSVSGYSSVGGLVGSNWGGHVTQCYSTDTVSGLNVGGLVGYNSGSVTDCYSTGMVNGALWVGGLVGGNSGSVTDCYSTAAVNGTNYVGGLAGLNANGHVTQCYSTGTVRGTDKVGGLVGYNTSGSVTSCFWDTQTSGRATSAGGTAKTTAQMQTASTFLCWGYEPTVWTIDEGKDYPRLWWESASGQAIPRPYCGGGGGTQTDPYLIYTPEQLNMIGSTTCGWDKCFKLMADIDMSGFDGRDGRPAFSIIGPDTDTIMSGFQGTPFTGVFDGNGHTLSHLTITGGGYLGLFGQMSGEVKDLGIVDVNITGPGNYVGGLVGYNVGTVTRCYSTGAVTGTGYYVGGLVGYNSGSGSITTSYSTGAVSGNSSVGGLVGSNSGSIATSYSTVSGTGSYVGGLVGSSSGSVLQSVWDMDTSGLVGSAGGVGLTTTEMMDPYMLGLNGFANDPNWVLNAGRDYPRLAWEGTPGQIIAEPAIDWLEGGGTAEDPYRVDTAEQLILLGRAGALCAAHFVLVEDIDLDPNLPGQQLFRHAVIPGFRGTFDGKGHTISHLTIKSVSYVGLFGRLESGGEVRNLAVADVNVAGSGSYVGGLVGYNSGSVTRCYSTGAVTGTGYYVGYVGGLVGYNSGSGSITTSYSADTVSGSGYVGGLVGANSSGTVTQCYSSGSVSGTSSWPGGAGGLVGYNYGGLVTESYSTGAVIGGTYVGGLVGANRTSPSSPVGSSFGFFSKKYTRYESIRSDLGDIIRVKAL